MTADIANGIEDRSARGIAAAIGRMVTTGTLSVDSRLPTVRELSKALGVSPTTVSEAWQTLAAVGAIEARGRLGTFVRRPTGAGGARRYRRVTEGPGHFALDLSTGTPDPALLPELGAILALVSGQTLTSSYLDNPVLPQLETMLRDLWPFEPETLTVVDGAMDALDRIAQVTIRLGDRVVVEHPTFPPLIDLLEQLGAEIIGVDIDDDGMSVDGLRDALAFEPSVLFLQPRAQNPTGASMSETRRDALVALLRHRDAVIVEDDHSAGIASRPVFSMGKDLPSRTVHIRSFSKSHGPDLRLAAVGGAGDVVSAVANRRLLGPGWSSRILQAVLVELLADPRTSEALESAKVQYAKRRRIVSEVLHDHHVPTSGGVDGGDGINVWMGVADERSALITLAAQGIGAAPGEPFMVRPDDPSLRITAGLLSGSDDQIAATARTLAIAAGFTPARAGQR